MGLISVSNPFKLIEGPASELEGTGVGLFELGTRIHVQNIKNHGNGGAMKVNLAILFIAAALSVWPNPIVVLSPDQAIVFGNVKLRPGIPIRQVEPQLKEQFELEPGLPDTDRRRDSIVLRPKEAGRPSDMSALVKGSCLPLPLGRLGTVAVDREGWITGVWKNWGESRDEEARALAYSLAAAFQSLAREGNSQARCSVRQGPNDNTTLIFDFGGKALTLTICDAPAGSKCVSLAEGFSSD
jgi:hypothetical protein